MALGQFQAMNSSATPKELQRILTSLSLFLSFFRYCCFHYHRFFFFLFHMCGLPWRSVMDGEESSTTVVTSTSSSYASSSTTLVQQTLMTVIYLALLSFVFVFPCQPKSPQRDSQNSHQMPITILWDSEHWGIPRTRKGRGTKKKMFKQEEQQILRRSHAI